jgi:DNA-binding LacI/PurR family transcriptional regulator
MQFLAAILTTASQMDRRVMLIPADDRQIQEVAEDYAVDGIIFLDERESDPRIIHLLDMGFPAVGLWDEHWDAALRKGFEELALHLESRGQQRVVCLCEQGDKLFVTKFKHTLTGTLQEHGITAIAYHCQSDTEAEVTQAIAQALKQNLATAIIASSDKLAIDAIHALHAMRLRVPDDCAVTGFGDVPASQWVQPPLTTIRVPVKAMAVWAVITVSKEEGTDKLQTPHNVGSRLIVRRSC